MLEEVADVHAAEVSQKDRALAQARQALQALEQDTTMVRILRLSCTQPCIVKSWKLCASLQALGQHARPLTQAC